MEKIREFNRSLTMPLNGYATEAEIRADARRSCQKPAEKSVRELAESSRVIQVEIRDRIERLRTSAGTATPITGRSQSSGRSMEPADKGVIRDAMGDIIGTYETEQCERTEPRQVKIRHGEINEDW